MCSWCDTTASSLCVVLAVCVYGCRPPKKKKGAKGKKGKGKKKGAKKGTKKKDTGPKLNQMERFFQFQVTTRSDAIDNCKARRDELLAQNAELQAELDAFTERRMGVVGNIRRKSMSQLTDFKAMESTQQEQLEDLIQSKQDLIREQEAAVAGLRERLNEVNATFRREQEELETLLDFRASDREAQEHHIALLRRTIADLEETHEQDLLDLKQSFQNAKVQYRQHLEDRLERTKENASTEAISKINPRNKVCGRGVCFLCGYPHTFWQAEYEDHLMLKRELERHGSERERLEAECEALEAENLQILRDMCSGPMSGVAAATAGAPAGATGRPSGTVALSDAGRWESVEEYKRQSEIKRFGAAAVTSDDEEEDDDDDDDDDNNNDDHNSWPVLDHHHHNDNDHRDNNYCRPNNQHRCTHNCPDHFYNWSTQLDV
eukprot:m.164922 g.164922  ORF g.164922 m.164922 type:complete len:433 (+) comp10320_c1_seq5:199-1497(+)